MANLGRLSHRHESCSTSTSHHRTSCNSTRTSSISTSAALFDDVESVPTDENMGADVYYVPVVDVMVLQATSRHENGKSHTVYQVSSSQICCDGLKRTATVWRRFQDFYSLHKNLSAFPRFQSSEFQKMMPSKKILGNMKSSHVEKRRIAFEKYLKLVLSKLPGYDLFSVIDDNLDEARKPVRLFLLQTDFPEVSTRKIFQHLTSSGRNSFVTSETSEWITATPEVTPLHINDSAVNDSDIIETDFVHSKTIESIGLAVAQAQRLLKDIDSMEDIIGSAVHLSLYGDNDNSSWDSEHEYA